MAIRNAIVMGLIVMGLTAALGAVPAGAADEESITAFSVWQAQGQTFVTGEDEATFIGSLEGPMYIETERGPLPAGDILCPAAVTMRLSDGTQKGDGRCVLTAKDGERIFAEVACTGMRLIGCGGDMKLTGGTGRFAGITGSGPIIIRSDFQQTAATSDTTARSQARGIIYLKDFKYTPAEPVAAAK